MADIFTKEKRSEIMRKVRNRDTDIELIVRKELFKRGYRFRVKNKLFGKPDIVLPRQKVVIFCDGDFWHGRYYRKEKKNYKEFWVDKIRVNRKRDITVNKTLKKQGWRVVRFWKTDILRDINFCIKEAEKILEISKVKVDKNSSSY